MFSTRGGSGRCTRRTRETATRPTCWRGPHFPSTPNWPVSTGSANTAAQAEPPFRVRSRPHPTRKYAGRTSASSLGQLRDDGSGDTGDRFGARERPLVRGGKERVDTFGVLARGTRGRAGRRRASSRARSPARARRQCRVAASRGGRRASPSRCDADRRPRAGAPACCACRTNGGKCVLLTAGFEPHTTTSRACTTSSGSAESMAPNISSHALPKVAAQIVSSTSDAPRSRNRRAGQHRLQRGGRRAVDPRDDRRRYRLRPALAGSASRPDRARRPNSPRGIRRRPWGRCGRAAWSRAPARTHAARAATPSGR